MYVRIYVCSKRQSKFLGHLDLLTDTVTVTLSHVGGDTRWFRRVGEGDPQGIYFTKMMGQHRVTVY